MLRQETCWGKTVEAGLAVFERRNKRIPLLDNTLVMERTTIERSRKAVGHGISLGKGLGCDTACHRRDQWFLSSQCHMRWGEK